VGLVALITVVVPTCALAQDRFDVGANVVVARSSEFDDTDTGVGGRFSWHPTPLVGADAEMTFYPASFPDANGFSSSRIEGLFGVTVGPRLAGVRPFVRRRSRVSSPKAARCSLWISAAAWNCFRPVALSSALTSAIASSNILALHFAAVVRPRTRSTVTISGWRRERA
jgi:hypothetical protein